MNETPIIDSLLLTLDEDPSSDTGYTWNQVDRRPFDTFAELPPNVYKISQYWWMGQVSVTIQVAMTHCHTLQHWAMDELHEALDFCSNYGGRYTL